MMLINKSVLSALRILFGLIIFASGFLKFLNINEFTKVLNDFALLPDQLIRIAAFSIPAIEICLGLIIIIKLKIKAALYATSLLLTIFFSIVLLKYAEGAKISCGCFGPLSRHSINLITIFRDLILLSLGFCLLIAHTEMEQRQTLFRFLLPFLILGIVAQNFGLVKQNQALKTRLAVLLPGQKTALAEGDKLPPLNVIDMNKEKSTIDFSGAKQTLLFIFSPHCKPCQKNQANWQAIVAGIRDSMPVLGISTLGFEETLDYFINNEPNYQVFVPDDESFAAYRVDYVPLTILVDNNGLVKEVWKGVLNAASIQSIDTKIQIRI
jgi:uncharacterized membrane protein YphA (DoxX/SURF4 family)